MPALYSIAKRAPDAGPGRSSQKGGNTMYKYELHCHTGDVSVCARITPEELVRRYDALGYSGLVLTNHYSPMTFFGHHLLNPQKAVEHYLSAYRRLQKFCGSSFTVLLGVELRHWGTVNDYLIYGVEEDWLAAQKDLLLLGEKKMSERVHSQGYLVYQAHPYRPFIEVCNPEYIDGIEVFNGHTSLENNIKALEWSELIDKPMISGSDTHFINDNICGGIATEIPIYNNRDLIDTLKSGKYELLCDKDFAGNIKYTGHEKSA